MTDASDGYVEMYLFILHLTGTSVYFLSSEISSCQVLDK